MGSEYRALNVEYRAPRVALDLEGVRTAVAELFEEALREKSPSSWRPPDTRSLTPGYYDWAQYLLWLDGERQFGPALELNAREVAGLRVVAEERNKFLRQHPPCPQCGELTERFAFSCGACGADLKPRGEV